MKIQTGGQYIESLRKIRPKIYYRGKRIEDVTRHPATAPHVRAARRLWNPCMVLGHLKLRES
jgi:4-hydroxybutyryl-CoA dehydratase/vinylacetyl-CoA-Delta-isomerase